MSEAFLDEFSLEHLVYEVNCSELPVGYTWYEMDWDAGHRRLLSPERPEGVQVICATRRSARKLIDEVLPSIAGSSVVTHVQFEVTDSPEDHQIVERLRADGLSTIASRHLRNAPSGAEELHAVVRGLAELGSALVKVVFPSTASEHVRWCTDLLHIWDHNTAGLSLTPRGSRQGRLAAALAGSRLVYAPPQTTNERMAAPWYRQLVSTNNCSDRDPGVDTW
jgi:hypothetical protein